MGVIRECGGKMHLREDEYDKAHTDFFEAFKNYDESGSPRRTTCLKYLVLANMLMKSDINPFDSQEAKPYKNDSEILAMTNLVNAYQNNDTNWYLYQFFFLRHSFCFHLILFCVCFIFFQVSSFYISYQKSTHKMDGFFLERKKKNV